MIRLLLLLSCTLIHIPAGADALPELKLDMSHRGDRPPDVIVLDLEGRNIKLSNHYNGLVLLNFWGTFCRSCLREMPAIEQLWRTYKDKGLTVLSITVEGGKVSVIKSLIDKHQLTFPILIDTENKAADAYQVSALPVSYIIKNGEIMSKVTGELKWNSPSVFQSFDTLLSSP
jgi:peroxiredoxin